MCLPDRHIESASRDRESVFDPSFRRSQSIHPGLRPRRLATLLSSERAGTPFLSAIVVDPPSLIFRFRKWINSSFLEWKLLISRVSKKMNFYLKWMWQTVPLNLASSASSSMLEVDECALESVELEPISLSFVFRLIMLDRALSFLFGSTANSSVLRPISFWRVDFLLSFFRTGLWPFSMRRISSVVIWCPSSSSSINFA